jgi:hypothetical protein
LEPKTLNRSDFRIDLSKEVRLLAKEMMKRISFVRAQEHLPVMISRFLHYQIGTKAYYEMMAIEFAKHIDSFNFKTKARLLFNLALADIDPTYIVKTAHKLCAAYSEAFNLDKPEDL